MYMMRRVVLGPARRAGIGRRPRQDYAAELRRSRKPIMSDGPKFSTIAPQSLGSYLTTDKMVRNLGEQSRRYCNHLHKPLEQKEPQSLPVRQTRSLSTPTNDSDLSPDKKSQQVSSPTSRQLKQLFLLSAIPFVGFGFADNFIMIVAGDAIDNSVGIKMGISTLAAAGLGNLISDVCGIGLGEFVESWSHKFGVKDPNLSPEQYAMRKTRWVKSLACIIGISLGCLLGMVPLLFLDNNKLYFFSKEEEELYEDLFLKNNVPPMAFFSLVRKGHWRTAEEGDVIVPNNQKLDKVLLIRRGVAVAYLDGKELYAYEGQVHSDSEKHADPERRKRGCVIGGTALVDQTVTLQAYKNKVKAEEKVVYLEWTLNDLKTAMEDDKHIRAAMFSILYKNLLKGLRNEKQRRSDGLDISEYLKVLEAVLADGIVHIAERELVDRYRSKFAVSAEQHNMYLNSLGWSEKEWEQGVKEMPPAMYKVESAKGN